MPEVRCVVAVVSNPIGPDDPGRATYGYYILENGLLTMTDGNGDPVRNTSGDKETHRLQDGEDPDYIAKRRAVKIHRQLRKNDNGFGRPLRYPPLGIA